MLVNLIVGRGQILINLGKYEGRDRVHQTE